jgi:hypothetical protein
MSRPPFPTARYTSQTGALFQRKGEKEAREIFFNSFTLGEIGPVFNLNALFAGIHPAQSTM